MTDTYSHLTIIISVSDQDDRIVVTIIKIKNN